MPESGTVSTSGGGAGAAGGTATAAVAAAGGAAGGAASAGPSAIAAKPLVSFEEFAKLDLRVARVLKCEDHPSADRLFRLQVDDGTGTPRQICAGVKGHYQAVDLVGQLIIIVANLAPRKIRGEESRGMLLAASDMPKEAAAGASAGGGAGPGGGAGAERKVIVLRPASEIAPGSIVS